MIKLIISIEVWSIILIMSIMSLLKFSQLFLLFLLCYACRLIGMFRTVFPYKNKIGNLIMGTEKAHFIVHSPSEVVNYPNPLNGFCDGPEAGHKIWVK